MSKDSFFDLSASIEQSAVDKVIKATKFPLTAVDIDIPFDPNSARGISALNDDSMVEYSTSEIEDLFKTATKSTPPSLSTKPPSDINAQFASDVLKAGSSVIESAKQCEIARQQAGSSFVGPPKEFVEGILQGGLEGLTESAKGLRVVAHCSWLEVDVLQPPTISLNGGSIGIGNVELSVSATGQLWWYHPTFHCSKMCFNWTTTWGWDQMGPSLTVRGVKISADASATVSTSGTKALASANVSKLRLDYPILDKIPLEGIANSQLNGKSVTIYDASKLIETIPVIAQQFTIDSIAIPAATGETVVRVSIRKV